MTIDDAAKWLTEYWWVVVLGAFFGIGFLSQAVERYGVYVSYFAIVLVLFAAALLTARLPYFFAFVLGMATAFAEIISKFADDPLKALKTQQALLYHVLNGAIAVFALWLIVVNGASNKATLDQVKNVLSAGLGSMLIMRSRLFNIKTDGEDVSFGPDQIIKIYFRFMEAAIDRVRAIDRIRFVKEQLSNKAFIPLRDYSETMLRAAQALEEDKRKKFDDAVKEISGQQMPDEQLASYRLGFALLNTMGEDFVRAMLEKWNPQWQIQAPLPAQEESLIRRLNPFAAKEEMAYLAYGSSMASTRFLERLNWTGIDAAALASLAKSARCELPGYRLVFNKPDRDGAGATGLPNLVPDPQGKVEGVLYRLPKDAIDFLDKTETGYRRGKVTVVVGGKDKVEAQAYFAEQTRDGLPANQDAANLAISGAEEHELNQEYVSSLRALLPKAA